MHAPKPQVHTKSRQGVELREGGESESILSGSYMIVPHDLHCRASFVRLSPNRGQRDGLSTGMHVRGRVGDTGCLSTMSPVPSVAVGISTWMRWDMTIKDHQDHHTPPMWVYPTSWFGRISGAISESPLPLQPVATRISAIMLELHVGPFNVEALHVQRAWQ
jgi:hypothetical protein